MDKKQIVTLPHNYIWRLLSIVKKNLLSPFCFRIKIKNNGLLQKK